jgi:chaperone modulatory protein CbpM
MIALDSLLRQIHGLRQAELEEWIEARWVLPERVASGYVFHEVDVARVYLIVELRHDLMVDVDAMPVILGLLDQVYALRGRLRAYKTAIESLPPDIQALLRERLKD